MLLYQRFNRFIPEMTIRCAATCYCINKTIPIIDWLDSTDIMIRLIIVNVTFTAGLSGRTQTNWEIKRRKFDSDQETAAALSGLTVIMVYWSQLTFAIVQCRGL